MEKGGGITAAALISGRVREAAGYSRASPSASTR